MRIIKVIAGVLHDIINEDTQENSTRMHREVRALGVSCKAF